MRRLILPFVAALLALSARAAIAQPAPLTADVVPADVQAAITQYAADQGYAYDGDCQTAADVGMVCSLVYQQSDGSWLVTFGTVNGDGTVSDPVDQLAVVPQAAPAPAAAAPEAATAAAAPVQPATVSSGPNALAPMCPNGFIPSPGNGHGPTLCRDGLCSHSAGRGTCSGHGGEARVLHGRYGVLHSEDLWQAA